MDKRITRGTTWIKRIVAGVLCLVVFMTTFFPATAYAAESETKTIRVGYFAFPGYHEIYQDETGTHGRGYGFDFLQLLRKYTIISISDMKTAGRKCWRCCGPVKLIWLPL